MANNSFAGEISFEIVNQALYNPSFQCSLENSGYCNPYTTFGVSNATQCDLSQIPGILNFSAVCSNHALEFLVDYVVIQKLAPGIQFGEINWDVSGRAQALSLVNYSLNVSTFDRIVELDNLQNL